MQDLRDRDRRKGRGDERHKGSGEPVRRFVKRADEEGVEEREDQKRPGEEYRVGVHHGVVHIYGSVREKNHPQRGQPRHQQERDPLDQADEEIPGLHRVLLVDRQQNAVQNVVCLPAAPEGLKNPEADEKRAHKDRITGDQSHKGKAQEQIAQRMGRQPQFLIQQVFHGNPPFRSGS